MRHDNDLRMRLQLAQKQSDQISQLRAHFTKQRGELVQAHQIVKWAVNSFHRIVFVKEGNPIPNDWEAYNK